MKRGLIVILAILIIIPLGYSLGEADGTHDPDESPSLDEATTRNPFVPETEDEFKEAVDRGVPMNVPEGGMEVDGFKFPRGYVNPDGIGHFPPDEPIIGPDGEMLSTESGLDLNAFANNEIPQADDLYFETPEGDISSGQGLEGMNWQGSDYTIDYADYWETESHKIVEGHGIQKSGGNIYVDEGHAIDSDDEFVNYADSYESSGDEFNIGEAKAVLLDGTLFTDIKDSYFKTKDGAITEASVTSSTDDNSFTLDGITVEMDENDTFNAKLDEETGKFDLSLDSEQGKIEATYPNVGCVEISPGSRFEYVGSDFDDFAMFVPIFGGVYELCIRTLENEDFDSDCNNCGVVDYKNKTAEFNGIYQYEKPSAFENGLFRNMIDAQGNYSMEADNHKFNNTCVQRKS